MQLKGNRTVGKTGVIYRSMLECRVLDALVTAGTLTYETERLPYSVPKNYTPDGVFKNGQIYIEVKGYFQPEDRTKTLLVRKRHPDIDLRFVFENAATRIGKRDTYGSWCDRNGFLWAQGHIPQEWLT